MVISAVFILIVVGYYYFIYEPLVEEINELEREKNQKQEELDLLIFKTGQISDLKEERDEYLEKKQELERARMSVSDLLVEIDELTFENNIEINKFNPERDDNEISLDFSLKGGYRELAEFFVELNFRENRLEFRDLNMEAEDDRERIRADVFIKHYRD